MTKDLHFKNYEPYFRLVVHSSHRAMIRAVKAAGHNPSNSVIAVCYFRNYGHEINHDPSLVAIIHLSRENLSVNTIAHECTHAAMAWIRTTCGFSGRLGTEPCSIDEELADTVGWLTEQVSKAVK